MKYFVAAFIATVASVAPALAVSTLNAVAYIDEEQFDTIAVDYTTDEPSEKNWIGIYKAGDGPSNGKEGGSIIFWDYADYESGYVMFWGARAGEHMEEGDYEAHFLKDDGYESLAEEEFEFDLDNHSARPPTGP